jgi:hypothetical protein
MSDLMDLKDERRRWKKRKYKQPSRMIVVKNKYQVSQGSGHVDRVQDKVKMGGAGVVGEQEREDEGPER